MNEFAGWASIILFLAAWALFFWLCFLVVRRIGSFLWNLPAEIRTVRRYRAFERELVAQAGRLPALSTREAEAMIAPYLEARGNANPWEVEVPAKLEAVLVQLDPGLASLLRRYHEVIIDDRTDRDDGTALVYVSAIDLESREVPDGYFLIGATEWSTPILCAKPGSPIVYELKDGQIVREYPSVYHYLLAEVIAVLIRRRKRRRKTATTADIRLGSGRPKG
jgi:hypothetical protein